MILTFSPPFLLLVCMCHFYVSVFRLQTQIWGKAVGSIIGSSTTRSCFPSMPLERSELRCHWTERSGDVMDMFRLHMNVIVNECNTKRQW